MNTKIHILNGNRIGGCVTLVTYGKTTVCIDYGQALPGSDRSDFESINWEREKIDAVFFTHYHGDHTGRITEIPEDIPLYMGYVSRNVMLNIHRALMSGDDSGEHMRVVERLTEIPEKNTLKAGGQVTVGSGEDVIRITPYVVDHSAYEAFMFLIGTPDKRILHTGDFRGHGYQGRDGETMLSVIDKYIRRNGTQDVDILITEGTMLGRHDEKVISERELQEKATELFKEHRHVFLICSSTNPDSLFSFYMAGQKQSPGMAMYGSRYLFEQLKFYSTVSANGKGYYDFRKIWPFLGGDKGSRKFFESRDGQRSIMRKNGFILVIKPEEYYKSWMEPFMDLDPVIVYSMWDGYLDKERYPDACNREWCDFREDHKDIWYELHTSGHASPGLIAKVIKAIAPRESVYLIHSEDAYGLSENINDGKTGELSFCGIDLNLAFADSYRMIDGRLMPPLKTIPFINDFAAKRIERASREGAFLDAEDFRARTGCSHVTTSGLIELGLIE